MCCKPNDRRFLVGIALGQLDAQVQRGEMREDMNVTGDILA
jgi:hypothetical protein